MSKPESKERMVLESFAVFDSSNTSESPPSFRSLAISEPLDAETLIYVGTDTGKLILLSLKPSASIEFLRSVSVTESSLDSIHVLVEIHKILALSDGFLFLLDSLLLQPLRRLGFPRGATVISHRLLRSGAQLGTSDLLPQSEPSRPGSRFLQKLGGGIRANGGTKSRDLEGDGNCVIAVAAGKKLVLVELDSAGSFLVLKVIQGIDGVKTMAWLNDSIIVGTVEGYTLFSIITGQSRLIFTLPESSRPPCLKSLSRNKEALLLVDNVGIAVNAEGQPVGGSLVFRSAPDSVGEMNSYVVAVSDGKMDLYHKKKSCCVQSISFAGEGVGRCVVANEESGTGEVVVVVTHSKFSISSRSSCVPLRVGKFSISS